MVSTGTTPAFAVIFRSNTHTAPNVRLPLIDGVHEHGCKCKAWCQSGKMDAGAEAKSLLRRVQLAARRAMRNATRYFGGLHGEGPECRALSS